MKSLIIFLVIVAFFGSGACTNISGKEEPATKRKLNTENEKPLKEIIDSLKIDINKIEIHIDKSDYALTLFADTVFLKKYPCVFGGNPVDDKRYEGDGCTPEGEFHLKAKYPHASWSKFMWVNYPTADSWKKFNEAKQKGEIPASATIGGDIGIHGVPGDHNEWIEEKVNWTLGCISLKVPDVDEIYVYMKVGTKVVIQK